MAMLKFGHAAVHTPVVCPGKWVDKKVPQGRIVTAKKVIAKYDPAQWLLSHVTIVASVDTDLADPKNKKSNYLIKPEYSIFVNNNGDCWERDLLRACYRTFLGADNYVEHVQIPELSKGKVIDVALREVPFAKGKDGEDLTTLYVDVLIATNRKHKDLIQKIESNEYNAVSMGCLIRYSICSQCGNKAEDESQACKHIRFFKNNFFYDKNGIRRIVAELCGEADDPESNKFVDASWVRKPAFEGAVKRGIIEPPEDVAEKINKSIQVPSFSPQPGMVLRAASDAAIQLVNEVESQDEVPAETPEAPKEDTEFPEAPAETEAPLEKDTPAEEAPKEEAPAEEAPAEDKTPEEGAPLEPGSPDQKVGPSIEEPAEDATVKEVKELVKKQILNEIRREILKEQAKEQLEEAGERPSQVETYTNDAFVRSANMEKVITASEKYGNEKFKNGIQILANLKDWKNFRKYGYSRNDVLGILYHIDKTLSDEPIGLDSVKALSKVKYASDLKPFFTEIILETGRRPKTSEAKKIAKWGKILSNFD